MNQLGVLLAATVFLAGCGQATIESPVQTDGLTSGFDLSLVEEEEEVVVEEVVPASWETYVNSEFGYKFSYPEDGVIWFSITDGLNPYVVGPTESSPIVNFTDANLNRLLDTEVNRLTIQVIEGERSAHEWLSQNLLSYFADGNAGQNTSMFAGNEAMILVGSGGYYSQSPAKMIVIQRGVLIYVIHYISDSFTFEEVLNTFEFL